METYREFLARIGSFQPKRPQYGDKYFEGSPSIPLKVGPDNTFRPFYGDTVVFPLDDGVKARLDDYVGALYRSAPECFCQRLGPGTFHMTLHDLSSAPALGDVAEELFDNELKVVDALHRLQKCDKAPIKMKSTAIFNMVDTSLVLGLYPTDEDGYRRLMELYAIFDAVKGLGYPFTPHITLAYYNVNGFSQSSARNLGGVVSRLNGTGLELELSAARLFYQKFRSMNDYIDIIHLGHQIHP